MVRATRSCGLCGRRWFPALVVFVSVAATGGGAGYSGENDLARDILDATGVKGGLVVHLGCGDGKLTAALRVNDSYLVHGLDLDAANVEAALREFCEAREWKPKELFMPVRIAVTGRTATPPLFETMEVLGKARCRWRLRRAMEALRGMKA